MSYHHLTTLERGRTQELLAEGYSHRAIAKKLNRHRSCIDREIRSNQLSTCYDCETAQHTYQMRRKNAKPKGNHTPQLVATIEHCLLATWSPEQIANTVTAGIIRFKTMYRWIYSGLLPSITVIAYGQRKA